LSGLFSVRRYCCDAAGRPLYEFIGLHAQAGDPAAHLLKPSVGLAAAEFGAHPQRKDPPVHPWLGGEHTDTRKLFVTEYSQSMRAFGEHRGPA